MVYPSKSTLVAIEGSCKNAADRNRFRFNLERFHMNSTTMNLKTTPQAVQGSSHIAAPGGHYSHAVVANNMIFLSGQLPITASGQKLVHATFQEQVHQTLANISAVLEACNADVRDLVHVRVYIDDIENWGIFNNIYNAWVGEWKPARAVVPVSTLHYGLKVEVEAVASLPLADCN